MKEKLLRSSFFRYIEIVVAMISGLIITPYLILKLGEMDYGLWILLLSTLGWFGSVDLGFSSAVQRQMSLMINQEDEEGLNRIFSCAIVLFFFLGGIASLGVFVLGIFPQILGVPAEKLNTASNIIFILCLKIFIDFLMNTVHGVFVGHIRYDIDANIGSISTILKTILVIFVVEHYGLYGVVFATILSDMVKNFSKLYYVTKLQDKLKFSWVLVSFNEIKSLFSFSKHVIASMVAKTINSKSDPVIIANILDVSAITMFNIASRLASMIEDLVAAIVGISSPYFINLVANKIEVEKPLLLVISINCFIAGLFFIPLGIMANDFITLWVGGKFSYSATLIFILILAFLSRTISRPISSLLLARAQHKTMSLVNLVGAVINIVMSIYLGYKYGLLGIVISTAVSFIVTDIILYLIMLRFYVHVSIINIIVNVSKLFLLYIIMSYLGTFLLVYEQLTWFALIKNSLIVFFVNFFLCWMLLLTSDAKEKIISILKSLSVFQKIPGFSK